MDQVAAKNPPQVYDQVKFYLVASLLHVMFHCFWSQAVFSVVMCSKVGPRICVPSFLEAALGQVASEGWEPSLQAVLMGAALTARKCSLLFFMLVLVNENLCPTTPVCTVPYTALLSACSMHACIQ